MNYDVMTDQELIHYLSLYSNDPLILRLVTINAHDTLFDDLVEAGMDPKTLKFGDGWESQYPGDYIQYLRRELDQAESDLAVTQSELEDTQEKYHDLKTRSIMDFVQEVWEEKRLASNRVSQAQAEIQQVKEQNEKLREQIDMWARMNHV